jgi:hypothetical protein
VDRWLINTIPLWGLTLLVVGVAVTLGVGGQVALRRFVRSYEEHSPNRTLSSAFSIAGGLFSFVLAFTIGQFYTTFLHADADARSEAGAIAQVLRASHGLPPALAGKVRLETLAYASEVRDHEWQVMRQGQVSSKAWKDIDHLYSTLEGVRSSTADDPFYAQTVSRVDDLVTARQARLDDLDRSIDPLFQALLLLGAVLTIGGTYFFRPIGEPLQVAMVGAASALVGMALLLAISLDYPFSGDISVSNAPYAQSALLLDSGG